MKHQLIKANWSPEEIKRRRKRLNKLLLKGVNEARQPTEEELLLGQFYATIHELAEEGRRKQKQEGQDGSPDSKRT